MAHRRGFTKMKIIQAGCVRFTTIAMFGLLAGPRLAYMGPAAAETAEAREACTHDAFRLCSDAMPDVARTKACLARNRASLSGLCRAAFSGGGRGSHRAR